MIVHVDSADDPRLAPYLAVKERDLVRRDGRFIVEGKVTVERLVTTSRFPVESLFLSERRLGALKQVLWRLPPDVPVYAAPQEIMDGVAGFHLHRGVLAVARRKEQTGCEGLLADLRDKPQATLLGLVGLSNHDNVGACFRNAAALGADAVLLDETSCDPLYRKAIRVSAGTALSLPFARGGNGESMAARLIADGYECWSLSPTEGERLQDLTPPTRLALLVGAEGPGLSEDLMAHTRRVSIPMANGVDSLNVATAAAIAMAHVHASRTG